VTLKVLPMKASCVGHMMFRSLMREVPSIRSLNRWAVLSTLSSTMSAFSLSKTSSKFPMRFFICLVKFDKQEWQRMWDINVMSAVRLCRAVLRKMLDANCGRIIIVASEAGMRPLPHMLHYSVSKTATIGLARGLAELTKGTAVTVNSVAAGPTWTEGVEKYMQEFAAEKGLSLDDAVKTYFSENETTSLLQRFIAADEIGKTVAFLASDGAAAINGSCMRVEGGILRHI
jgi:NAD(P)-dependent dehydrogenase (short-subunit alcohol dehydrogenase family)